MRDRKFFGNRKGRVQLTTINVVGAICVVAAIVFAIVLYKRTYDRSTEASAILRANRAYVALDIAGYVDPEITGTYEDIEGVCLRADDEIGYAVLAARADGVARMSLTVCCPSSLSTRACRVDRGAY